MVLCPVAVDDMRKAVETTAGYPGYLSHQTSRKENTTVQLLCCRLIISLGLLQPLNYMHG